MKYSINPVLSVVCNRTFYQVVNCCGSLRGVFDSEAEAVVRCAQLNSAADEWKRKADEALDDFNYVGSRHHY